MADADNRLKSSQLTSAEDAEAIRHLRQAIVGGRHWYIALLEAVGLWTDAEETHDGRKYRYLIAGEAFDWLLLAERLCGAVDGLLPDDEKTALLFYGAPPLKLTPDEFRGLIGEGKYRQYLNYFYGVVVEEALFLAVQEEVRKEKRIRGYHKEHDTANEVYRRIYGATKTELLKRFRQEKKHPLLRSITLTELKEFTYWLFKYRLRRCDKTRVASDTRKALEQLRRQWADNSLTRRLLADPALIPGPPSVILDAD
jgi:hypothetical protein